MMQSADRVRLILRLAGLAVGLVVGAVFGNTIILIGDDPESPRSALLTITVAIGTIGYLLGPHLTPRVLSNLKATVRRASTLDIAAVAIGLFSGAIISAPLALPLSFLPGLAGNLLPVLCALAVCTLTISVAVLRKRDLIAPLVKSRTLARLEMPTAVSPATPVPAGALIDTSVAIDGRLADLVRTGFIDYHLIVPRFVVDELQHIADSEDPLRRVRGRRGLETLARMQQELDPPPVVIDDQVPEEREVDAKLVRLAKRRGLKILTNDYNLNKVAQLQGVIVLNLNELQGALRPAVLPGEEINLKVIQEGREAGQGVGFLDDGTMVVIDGGKTLVGTQTNVTVTRLLQTGTGRMIFATPTHAVSGAS
jgi:uncharacterized protein YacL